MFGRIHDRAPASAAMDPAKMIELRVRALASYCNGAQAYEATFARAEETSTADEMKARWIYSELGSPRWNGAYIQLRGSTPLLEKATLHVPFSSLTSDERVQLLKYAPNSARRGLMGRLSNHLSYRLEHWSKLQMSATRTIQAYGSVPYDEFLAGNCRPGEEAADPREAAITLPYYPGTWEAGIAVGQPGDYLLLDGYTRSVAFMKKAPHNAKFAIWVPDESPCSYSLQPGPSPRPVQPVPGIAQPRADVAVLV